MSLFPRGGLDCEAPAHHDHREAAGDAEERVQQLPEARATRAGTAVVGDRPGHAGGAGTHSYTLLHTYSQTAAHALNTTISVRLFI